MKTILTILTLLYLSNATFGQILSGEYEYGLKLAFENKTNKLTGYFENYSGFDEETKNHRFSCIFYIEGVLVGNNVKIKTYYPADNTQDTILGTLEIIDNNRIKIKLSEEHGGCWNVQHFSDEKVHYKLEKEIKWTQIRCIINDKSYFYKEKTIEQKQKSYLVKGDFVCIEKTEGDWAFCTYYGKKITKGWIKTKDLN